MKSRTGIEQLITIGRLSDGIGPIRSYRKSCNGFDELHSGPMTTLWVQHIA